MTHLMKLRNPLQPRRALILRPAPEQLSTLIPDIRVRQLRSTAHAQPLQQRLVYESSLEPRSGILDEAVKQNQGADLTVDVAVFELLADGAGGLGWSRGLELDDLDELGDAAHVIFLVGFACEVLDGDGDRRVGFLLFMVLIPESLIRFWRWRSLCDKVNVSERQPVGAPMKTKKTK